ncbi:uncharacterized protein LOC119779028 [Cyprinodon tularosa]|uniref:uncharacterized protein LOC119779028 n=1 Tax=Cyprinodon tularosa TaxID=77115 RepID=UPI0018E1EAEB|nr:uncharacterized protein LOC119779028 [Cyprinodon tularosa]
MEDGVKVKEDGHCDQPSGEVKVGEAGSEDPEVWKVFANHKLASIDSLAERFVKFSSWSRLVKATARLIRFGKEFKRKQKRTNEPTSLEERQEAELAIIAIVQGSVFSKEIKELQSRKELTKDKTNKLHRLNPFLDHKGVLRVGGRLEQATLHPYVKHPAILPKTSHITRLLIDHYHQRVRHQGRSMTINEIRANGIWILGCSQAVSSYIYNCVKCRKSRRGTEAQKMANLPNESMETTSPCTHRGRACFGPFYVKERLQYLATECWKRWKKKYLLGQHHRQKWQKTRRNAKVNDIVFIKDEPAPRNDWKLAKVTAVYPSEDGCVRKVQLLISDSSFDNHGKRQTKQVYLDRPIHKTVTLLEAG